MDMHKGKTVKTEGQDRQVKLRRGFRRSQLCQHLDLRPPAS
jgi:hypothetical protein